MHVRVTLHLLSHIPHITRVFNSNHDVRLCDDVEPRAFLVTKKHVGHPYFLDCVVTSGDFSRTVDRLELQPRVVPRLAQVEANHKVLRNEKRFIVPYPCAVEEIHAVLRDAIALETYNCGLETLDPAG